MELTKQLAVVFATVTLRVKSMEGKLCSKTAFSLIRDTVAQALEIVKETEATPEDKRKFLEDAAAHAFDTMWAAAPLPMALQWLRTSIITNNYIRPNALWAIDVLVDDAFAEIAPLASNTVVQEVLTVAENVVPSTVTVTTSVVNTPPTPAS